MVKSHAEIHTNPRREVARFSDSPYVELNNKTHRLTDRFVHGRPPVPKRVQSPVLTNTGSFRRFTASRRSWVDTPRYRCVVFIDL